MHEHAAQRGTGLMWLLSPLTWLVLAACLLVPALRLRARWPAAACAALAAIAVAGMTPLVANSLVARLEQPGRVDGDCSRQPPPTIVVLAGGLQAKPQDATDFSVLGIASRRRLERAVQYWRQDGGRSLVITGTSLASDDDGVPSDALLMAAYAGVLDVPDLAVRIEPDARDTWGNALNVAALRPRIPRRIALVTSALHMRRATFAFRTAGFQVCPLPADSRLVALGFPGCLMPRSSSLNKTEDVLHELAGLAYYHWRSGGSQAAGGPENARVGNDARADGG